MKTVIDNGAKAAHYKVLKAVKAGNLVNLKEQVVVCVDCGERALQYDHRDYNKPLDVEPVCIKCNRRRGSAKPIDEIKYKTQSLRINVYVRKQDRGLYVMLKEHSVDSGRSESDIVAEALREYFERRK